MRRVRDAASRPGFTTIEVVVILAVLAVLATVTLLAVTGRGVRGGQTAALSSNLETLATGIAEFRADVRRYPSQLTYLAAPLAGGATDACGAAIPGGFASLWQGPYVSRAIPATGLPSGTSLIQTALERDPATGGPTDVGTLFIVVQDVDEAVALALEESFDGASDFTTGTIRWVESPPGSGRGVLRYAILIRGC